MDKQVLERTKEVVKYWWRYNELMGVSRFILKRSAQALLDGFVESAELVFNSQDMNLKHLLLVVVPSIYHTFSPSQMQGEGRLATDMFYNLRNAICEVLDYMAVKAPSRCITNHVPDDCSPFAKELLRDWNGVVVSETPVNDILWRIQELHIKSRFLFSLGHAIKKDLLEVTFAIDDKINALFLQFLYDDVAEIWDLYRYACDIAQKKREIKCLFDYAKKRQEVLNEVNR